jgi:hypothetical protein
VKANNDAPAENKLSDEELLAEMKYVCGSPFQLTPTIIA